MKNTDVSKEALSRAFGPRIFAFIIDAIMWGVIFLVAAATLGTTITTGSGSMKSTSVRLTGWPAVAFFLVELSYFILLEWRLGGTVGKLLLGVRVSNNQGGPITLKQSVTRNILRVVDAFPYFVPYLTGLVLGATDDRKRRFGDRVANTLVASKKGARPDGRNDWTIA
jgi:uncharacterized RDD family membrane protein YckC